MIPTFTEIRTRLLLRLNKNELGGGISQDISPNDLLELVECMELSAAISTEEQISEFDIPRLGKDLLDEAQKRKRLQDSGVCSYEDRGVPGDLSIGSWVIVKGLKTITGYAMNGKLGYIHSGPKKERFVVEIEGLNENKTIKGCNLDPVPIDDVNRGIVACLNTKDQWSFMGDVVKGNIVLIYR